MRRWIVMTALAVTLISFLPRLALSQDAAMSSGDLSAHNLDRAYRKALTSGDKLSQHDFLLNAQALGDRLVAKGDLAGALDVYREQLDVARKIAAEAPQYSARLDDIAVADEAIGDVLMTQGDLAGARTSYEEDVSIRRQFVMHPPLSITSAVSEKFDHEQLSGSLQRLGAVLAAQSDLVGARRIYEEWLAIARPLASKWPRDVDDQRDLTVCLWRLAKMGGTSVHWVDVVAQLETNERQHMILPSDQTWPPTARRYAAEEVAK